MAYSAQTWKDRAVQYAKRYFLRDNGGSDKNLLPPFNEGWTLHENTRMKQANFVGKISASTVENPNIIKYGFNASLLSPSSATENTNQTQITNTSTLNGALNTQSGTTNLQVSQTVFSFDLIEHVLRNYGSSVFGVAVTTPERVAWLKLNVAKFNVNWHGYGSSPSGNKAYLGLWNTSSSLYDGTLNHTSGSVTKITQTSSNMTLRIDTSGFVHFIAYADASNGSTASTINTDFIELEVYMAAGSIPQADYVLTLNATATNQNSSYIMPANASTQYTMSITLNANSKVRIDALDNTQTLISMVRDYSTSFPYTFTTPANTYYLLFYFSNTSAGVGTYTFTNPQIELGSSATSFAPMKSYDVTQAPGIVTQAGTPLNAANLNTLETGLQTAAATADTHIALQTAPVHGSTSANTASKLVHRDANARAQFADPSAAQDAATKNYVDTHANLTNPHSSTSAATASRLVLRDASGRAKMAAPSASDDIAIKQTVDNLLASPAFTGTPTAPTAAVGTNTTQLATTEFVTTAGSLVLITNTYSAIDTSAISFTSIPGTYKDLILLVHGVSTTTGSNLVGVSVTVNDVTTGYGYSYAYWDSSGSPTATGTTGTYFLASPIFAGQLTSSSSRGFVELLIPNYTAASGYKTMHSRFGTSINASSYHGQGAGTTSNVTGAITKITVTMNTGSFAGGVQMTLYGRK